MSARNDVIERILVTGAAGFVGTFAMAELRRVYPAATIVPGGIGGGGGEDFLEFDIADRDATRAAIARAAPSAILHLAAIADPAEAGRESFAAWDINFRGVMNVVEAALARDPQTRIVFAGSSESYGAAFRTAQGPIKETAALEPLNIYGATKAAADIYLGERTNAGARIVRFRPFNHTGPGQAPAFVAPAFAQQIAAIERGLQPPAIMVGNLDVYRDLLDVRDVVRAYVKAFSYNPAPGDPTVFNLATGAPVLIRTALDILLGMSQSRIEIRQDPARLRKNEIASISGDPARAAMHLGWRADMPIEQTLADVLAYFRDKAAH